jgi:hypothetical protein
MKQYIFFFLLFAYCYQTKAQEISFTPNTSHYEIITKLFEGRWDSLKQECVWKPNLAEKLQFNPYDYVIYDKLDNDFLYTKLEKSFYYETKYGNYIVFITSTYVKDKEGKSIWWDIFFAPSMSMIILKYDKLKQTIILDRFEKYITFYGSWDLPPSDITLIQIGEDEYCIKVVDDFVNTWGYRKNYTTLYYQGNEVLSFISDEHGESGESEEYYFKYSTSMTIDKATKKITLHKKGTHLKSNSLDNTPKIVPVDEIKTYKFNGLTFELVCGN